MRTVSGIQEEIKKVERAERNAKSKLLRCESRLDELREELATAKEREKTQGAAV